MVRKFLLLISFFVWQKSNAQILDSTNLPIIKITTAIGDTIVNEPRINAKMEIIFNDGNTNHIDDVPNIYDGNIAIELRGQTSQYYYAKKPYRLETQDENGENRNVELLGMPKENDWILQGPYSDKTLIRNVLTYDLGRSLGQYTTRTQLSELVINDEYMGVYSLNENIKRDKNRVDIAKLEEDDIDGESVTGGYIFRIDKISRTDVNIWESSFPANGKPLRYQIIYPKPDDLQPEQWDYLTSYVSDFETATFGNDFQDPEMGFRKYIDEDSFIDFFLMNELSRNPDAYRISTYFHKDKNEKIKAGPIWDFNLGYGNANFCAGSNHEGWILNYHNYCPNDPFQVADWWDRLFSDPAFSQKTIDRWKSLRANILSNESIMSKVDSLTEVLETAQVRNFERWPVLGVRIWPNDFVGATYESEINQLKSWLKSRLLWMDGHIENVSSDVNNFPSLNGFKISPNPITDELTIKIQSDSKVRYNLFVYDAIGRKVANKHFTSLAGQETAKHFTLFHLRSGIYFLQIIRNGEFWETRKILKI